MPDDVREASSQHDTGRHVDLDRGEGFECCEKLWYENAVRVERDHDVHRVCAVFTACDRTVLHLVVDVPPGFLAPAFRALRDDEALGHGMTITLGSASGCQ